MVSQLRFIQPQLLTSVEQPPEGEEWLHEVKHDGYRTLLIVENGQARAYTRTGLDWTDRYPGIVRASANLRCRSAILDGEVIVQDERGASDFEALKSAIKWQPHRLISYAFDLLYIDGKDLRDRPLVERRAELRKLVGSDPASSLQYSEEIVGDGAAFFRACAELGLEGVVSKLATSRYRSGRSRTWLKCKCFTVGSFMVIGTDRDRKTGAMRALLAQAGERGLIYAGAALICLSAKQREELQLRLQGFSSEVPPIAGLRLKAAQWSKPELVVRVRHLAGTNVLRHATVRAVE